MLGIPLPTGIQDEGAAWLAGAITDHCQPRAADGRGRGEKTRFVAFGLLGLSLNPDRLIQPESRDAIDNCLTWLLANLRGEGWPEEVGANDVSLFQTSAVVRAACAVIRCLEVIGRNNADDTDSHARASAIVDAGVRGLLYHRLSNGAWPPQSYGTNASPSKTSLALLALADAWKLHLGGDEVEVGGAHPEGPTRIRPEDILAQGGEWLVSHASRWVHFIETDPDVSGTQWEHLAFALALQAVIQVSDNEFDTALAPAWQLIIKGWSPTFASWLEPKTPPTPSVRASFSSVCVYEELRAKHGASGIARVGHLVSAYVDGATEPPLDLVRTRSGQFLLAWPLEGIEIPLDLPPRLLDLLRLLAPGPGEPVPFTTANTAKALVLGIDGVGQYIGRLNKRVEQLSGGRVQRLVISQRSQGYRLAVQRVVGR
jgi:hypothetical protein